MARKKVSKAEHIRRAFASLGKEAAPKDVIATLAAKKIKVSAAQVSNLKASLNGGPKPKRGRKTSDGSLTLSDLMAAKQLAGEIGLEKAQAALAALAKLSL